MWLLNRGWPLKRLTYLFYIWFNFLLIMDSLLGNCDKCVFESFSHWSPSVLDSFSTIAFSKTKFYNFGWPLNNRGKDNRKTLIGTTKRWPQPLNRTGQLMGIMFTVFY